MTKEDLNQMYREYHQVLSMSESEVFAMYEESKAECLASYEAEIDFWENHFYGSSEEEEVSDGLDPAFSSWYQVNVMFV